MTKARVLNLTLRQVNKKLRKNNHDLRIMNRWNMESIYFINAIH